MSNIDEQIEILLYNFFQGVIEEIEAAYVFDREGLLIAKKTIAMQDSTESEDMVYGAVVGVVDSTLKRINSEYPGSFGTGTFETEDHRLNFIEAGSHAILLSVFKSETMLSKVMPYCYLVAEKVARIVEGRGENIDLSIPNLYLGYELELDTSVTNGPLLQFNVDATQMKKEMHFKLCVIGEPAVGKTSLINQFVHEKFITDYKPTLGISITSQSYDIQGFDEKQMNFMIWDVAGQKFFQRVRQYYYMGSNVTFIVFDTTRRETFEKVEYWFDDIHKVIPNLPIVIVGNKIDLDADRQVSHDEGESLARKLRCSYMETSAKSGENVRDAFSIVGIGLFFKIKKKREAR